jgi:hypothetical protein
MKTVNNSSHGFILVLTLIILSIMVIMVTQLFNRGRIHLYFARAMIDREQAKMLALGGVQLAMSQLAIPPEEDKSEGKKDEKEKPNPDITLLKNVLPFLNVWQEFNLKEEVDGMQGMVKICISSEDGKIDINQIFDFSTKKFLNEGSPSNDVKKALNTLFSAAKRFLNNKDLFEPFEKFLKQRQYMLRDVTELLTIEEFQNVFKDNVFYDPPASTKKEQRPVYLTDIFTIWSGETTMNSWLLSDSIRALFALKRSESSDRIEQEKSVEQLKNVKSVSGDLKTMWEQNLEKMYAKEFKALPQDLTMLLSNTFHAKTFSVLSYGTVGKITQKVLAIIEAQEPIKFIVKKLYWL